MIFPYPSGQHGFSSLSHSAACPFRLGTEEFRTCSGIKNRINPFQFLQRVFNRAAYPFQRLAVHFFEECLEEIRPDHRDRDNSVFGAIITLVKVGAPSGNQTFMGINRFRFDRKPDIAARRIIVPVDARIRHSYIRM